MKTGILERKQIGKKFAAERERQQLSQSELADRLGIDRRRIWQFERGTALTVEHLALLSKFFNKPIEFFISE